MKTDVFCVTGVQMVSELTILGVRGCGENWLGGRMQAVHGEHWWEPRNFSVSGWSRKEGRRNARRG